jgi:hypothetical protein
MSRPGGVPDEWPCRGNPDARGVGAGTPVRRVASSWRSSGPPSGATDIFHPHLGDAIASEFKQFGGLVRDIDEAVAMVRPQS